MAGALHGSIVWIFSRGELEVSEMIGSVPVERLLRLAQGLLLLPSSGLTRRHGVLTRI
jgi:hypothetical protein